jgi:phosphatidylinositol alpha-1,6-mannosyltransferase
MRTMILTEHFLPAKGGSIKWLLSTYSRYSPEEVVVVAPQQEGDTQADRALPYRVERIPMTMSDWDPTVPASLSCYFHIMWRVYRYSRKYGVQQIHCAKVLPEGFVAWAMRLLNGIPYLIYAHGEEIQIGLTSRKLSRILPRIYSGASAIIANSRNTKALLQGIGVDTDKIHIIHPGVDTRSFDVGHESAQYIRQKHNLGTAPVLLTVGRLQRRKGQDMVIQALPGIRSKFPQVKYVLVGTGEELSYLQSLTKDMGVSEGVIFAGRVLDQELAAYYAACDIFIMPNREIGPDIEGFGMVYLEAGAAGKPVIGGASGGTDDAILDGTTGLRVDGRSVEVIINAVVSLLADPARAKAMGEAGRRMVENKFTWETVVRRTRLLSAGIEKRSKCCRKREG